MGTSIGQIQLDLEVKSDLDSDIEETTSKLAKQIREGMKAYSNDLFKDLRTGLEKSLNSVQQTIENCLNKTKSEMQSFVEQMKAIVKNAKFEIPIINNETPVNPMQSVSQKANAIRGPPMKVKMPSVDLSNNTNVIKAQINDTISQMSILTGTIKSQETQLELLEKEYQDVFSKIQQKNSIEEELSPITEKAKDLRTKIDQLEKSLSKVTDDKKLAINKELEKTRSEFDSTRQKVKELAEQFNKLDSNNLEFKLENINQKMLKMQSSISSGNVKKVSLGESLGDLQGKITPDIDSSSIRGKIASIRTNFSEMLQEFSSAHPILSKIGSTAVSVFSKVGTTIKNVATKSVQKLESTLKSASKKLLQFITGTKSGSNANDHFGNSFKRLLRSMSLITLGMYALRSGMRNLMSYMISTLKTNKQFVSSLNQIKSNLQTAFTPIYQAALPALNSLMSGLATITAYISAFISAIFGKSLSSTKAATDSLNDARDAVNGVGSSAKDTANKVKEATRSLMGFDVINKLDKKDDSSSGGSGSSNGSIYTPSDIDTSTISDFGKRLRELWEKGDFSGIGKLIGEKINEAVNSFTEFISWDRVGNTITNFINAFCDIFNSLVETINWENIGKMFGTGINTIVNTFYLLINGIDWERLGQSFAEGLNGLVQTVDWDMFGATLGSYIQSKIDLLYGFVTTADWAGIGKALGDSVMGLVNRIDWSKAGQTLSAGVRGLFKTLQTAIANIDWEQLGNDVWKFLSNIDWAGIVRDLAYLLGQSIAGIGKFLWGFIKDAVSDIGDYWAKELNDCGGYIVLGLLKGIVDGIAGIGVWIKKNIFDPFIDGIKSIFGIKSPSKVMKEIGVNIIQGLINGIGSLSILDAIAGAIGDALDWLGEVCGDFYDKGVDLITSIKEGIEDNPIVKTVGGIVSGGRNAVRDACAKYASDGKTLMSNFKNGVSTITISSAVGSIVNNGIAPVKSKYSQYSTSGKNLMTYLKNGVSKGSITSTINNIVKNGLTTIKNKNSQFTTNGKTLMTYLKNGVSTNTKNVVTQVSTVASKISSTIKSKATDKSKGWGADMMKGLASGIKSNMSNVTNAVNNVANSMSRVLHFSRPDEGPLREYEKWMPDMMKGMRDTLDRASPQLLNSVRNIANDMATSLQSIQNPEIAFAGKQDITVTHIIENETEKDDLKAILEELKNFKEYFEMVKNSIDNKELVAMFDGDKAYSDFVNKHNKRARQTGKSDLDI